MCSSRKYPAYAPTLPTEGNGNSDGRGVQKKSVSKDCGLLTEFFFQGGWVKLVIY